MDTSLWEEHNSTHYTFPHIFTPLCPSLSSLFPVHLLVFLSSLHPLTLFPPLQPPQPTLPRVNSRGSALLQALEKRSRLRLWPRPVVCLVALALRPGEPENRREQSRRTQLKAYHPLRRSMVWSLSTGYPLSASAIRATT